MRQIRSQHQQKIENLGKGHGQYCEITQDEFIQEITGSMSVICHSFHRDFQKCEIMNLHLSKLAQRHIESKFVRINAEKTPFFVEKVRILINPHILLYYFITILYLLSFVIVMFIMLNQWSRVQFDYLLCVICNAYSSSATIIIIIINTVEGEDDANSCYLQ
jgi:hypothetical protein